MADAIPSRQDLLVHLTTLFRNRGAEAYLGEDVTVAQHMLQSAALARAEGAPAALIAAALLHDIGHIAGPAGEYTPLDVADRAHEAAGATLLEGHFPPEVIEPIRWHVAAKRYLCATEASYADRLSTASRHSLSLQGGPMDAREVAEFRAMPLHREAISVRLWDDRAKCQDLETPPFEDYLPLLEKLSEQCR